MKKTIRNLLLIVVALLVCNVGEAKAIKSSVYCVYQDTEKDVLTVTLDKDGNFDIEYHNVPTNTTGYAVRSNAYLSYYNFISDENGLGCLEHIYFTSEMVVDTGGRSGTSYRNYYSSLADAQADSDLAVTTLSLNESLSQVYMKDEDIAQLDPWANKCRYGDVLLYFNSSDDYKFQLIPKQVNGNDYDKTINLNYFDSSILTDTCPAELYIRDATAYTDNGILVYSSDPNSEGYQQNTTVSSTPLTIVYSGSVLGVLADESVTVEDGKYEGGGTTPCAVFGEKTTKLIEWAIDLIQIAIPVIIIIMSIVDFTGVALSGEEKNFKAAGSKLVKRLVIGIAFILLPMLLAFIIDFSGALVPYGIEKDQLFCSLF